MTEQEDRTAAGRVLPRVACLEWQEGDRFVELLQALVGRQREAVKQPRRQLWVSSRLVARGLDAQLAALAAAAALDRVEPEHAVASVEWPPLLPLSQSAADGQCHCQR